MPEAPQSSSSYAFAVDRPVATIMIVCALCVFGYLSYERLHIALMPELNHPTLTIHTEYEGAAPEEIEQEISNPLEDSLRTVEGLRTVRSVSRAGNSDVTLEFRWGADMDFAAQKVRERLELLKLPEVAERPLLLRYDPTLDPIIRLAVHGDASPMRLRRYAEDEAKRALEKVEGVAMVKVHGGQESIIRVELNHTLMRQRGLSAAQVMDRLQQENINLAGGRLEDGSVEYLVRTLGEFRDLGELKQLVIGRQGDAFLRLGQISDISYGHRDRKVITRMGAGESVEIEVFKEADANLVEVAARVQQRLFDDDPESHALKHDLPEGIELSSLSDRSVFIRAAIDEVSRTALLGGILAIFTLFLFLRSLASTAIISVAIPLSITATFGALYLLDVTLNIMSLGGLALGIGMLVDNAVVVLESIFRCREEGDDPRSAALRGTSEVGGAVVASTLTTVAVFAPIVFIEGVAGQLFGDLALTVVISLIASLFVALYFVPMLAARAPSSSEGFLAGMLKISPQRKEALKDGEPEEEPEKQPEEHPWRLRSLEGLRDEFRAQRAQWQQSRLWVRYLLRLPIALLLWPYITLKGLFLLVLEVLLIKITGKALRWFFAALITLVALTSKALSILTKPAFWLFDRAFELLQEGYRRLLRGALKQRLLVLLIAGGMLFWSATEFEKIDVELIPTVHQGELLIDLSFPVEFSLEDTSERVAGLEASIQRLPNVVGVSSFAGQRDEGAAAKGANTATLTLQLASSQDIAATEQETSRALRKLLAKQAGIQRYDLRRPSLFNLDTPIGVKLVSDNLQTLRRGSASISALLKEIPGIQDVRSSLSKGYPEVHVQLDRDAIAARGLNAKQIADAVQHQLLGRSPTRLREASRRVDIVVRLARRFITDLNDLKHLIISPQRPQSAAISLSQVASIAPPVEGPSEIRHIEGQRVAMIEATPKGIGLSQATLLVYEALDGYPLPGDLSAEIAGQSQEIDDATQNLLLAFALAVFLVYIVMASRFEALSAPLVILLTIPLAAVGVIGALSFTGTPLSVVVFIGVIMLAGIVVNNAIVLVDYVLQLRARGLDKHAALERACTLRLRPILITTLTTILGLLPLALGLGEGAEIRAPMAIAVMGGLASSTLLTLLVIPVLYDLIGEIGRAKIPKAEKIHPET